MTPNWLRETTQAYRRGFVEGEAGMEDAYLLKSGIHGGGSDLDEYHRGFEDGQQQRRELSKEARP